MDSESKPHSVDGAQLPVLVRNRVIGANTLVWCDGMPNWRPLRDVQPELFLTPPPPPITILEPPPVPRPVPVPAPRQVSLQPDPQRVSIPSFARGAAPRPGSWRRTLVKCLVIALLLAVPVGAFYYFATKHTDQGTTPKPADPKSKSRTSPGTVQEPPLPKDRGKAP